MEGLMRGNSEDEGNSGTVHLSTCSLIIGIMLLSLRVNERRFKTMNTNHLLFWKPRSTSSWLSYESTHSTHTKPAGFFEAIKDQWGRCHHKERRAHFVCQDNWLFNKFEHKSKLISRSEMGYVFMLTTHRIRLENWGQSSNLPLIRCRILIHNVLPLPKFWVARS